jgi:hypothetical protein
MKITKGYCVLTECMGGSELVWRVLNEDGDYPEIYDTERDAQVAIVDNQIEHMQEFLTHDREYEDIDWQHDYTVAYIEIDEEGNMIVKDDSQCLLTDGPVIMRTTLQEWREQL